MCLFNFYLKHVSKCSFITFLLLLNNNFSSFLLQNFAVVEENRRGSEGLLVKSSCHDSGIDIRDPPPVVPAVPKKAIYTDADVLLSDDFVPPIPVHPLLLPEAEESTERRKKTSSVSFSLDDAKEGDENVPMREKHEEGDRQESRKNKVSIKIKM